MLGTDRLLPGGGQGRGGLLGLHMQVAHAVTGRAGGGGDFAQGPPRSGVQRGGSGSASFGDADQELGRAAAAAVLMSEPEGTLDRLQVRTIRFLVADHTRMLTAEIMAIGAKIVAGTGEEPVAENTVMPPVHPGEIHDLETEKDRLGDSLDSD